MNVVKNLHTVHAFYPAINMTMIQKLYGLGVGEDTKQMWKYKNIMGASFKNKIKKES